MKAVTPEITTVDTATSTNTLLATIAQTTPHGTVVRAVAQTAGRGQRGNSWEAEPGQNLTFSLLLRDVGIDATDQFIISQMVALGVADTLAAFLPGREVEVKWPNDIYVGDKKICGILIECSLSGRQVSRAICGIGINVNQLEFRSDAPNPVSLRQLTGKTFPLVPLLEQVSTHILELAATPCTEWEEVRARYMKRLYRREGFHPFAEASSGRQFSGRIVGIEPTGHIIIAERERPDNAARYAFKEVVFLP